MAHASTTIPRCQLKDALAPYMQGMDAVEKKRFVERAAYWIGHDDIKKHPFEKAIALAVAEASNPTRKPRRERLSLVREGACAETSKESHTSNSGTTESNDNAEICRPDMVSSLKASVREVNEVEVAALVEQLKQSGVMSELPSIDSGRAHSMMNRFDLGKTSNIDLSWKSNTAGLNRKSESEVSNSEQGFSPKDIIEIALISFIIVGALILNTWGLAKVLGGDIEGWAVAVLLEASIIGISLATPRKLGQKRSIATHCKQIGTFMLAIGLVVLSIALFHSGQKSSQSDDLRDLHLGNPEILSLEADKGRKLHELSLLPEDRRTLRRELNVEIDMISEKLSAVRGNTSDTQDLEAKKNLWDMTSNVRIALYLVVIFFVKRLTHLMVRQEEFARGSRDASLVLWNRNAYS